MIQVKNISFSFDDLIIFSDFSLEFPEGKITAILGPSGCGKTTLLNLLAGLLKAQKGKVQAPGSVSYLFQEPRLLPWSTVWDNVALPLWGKLPDHEIEKKTTQCLQAAGLLEYRRYLPSQLSGGMRQRAAMARAFSYPAPLLLMDEPFKSLDLKTRFQIINDFINFWRQNPRTVVMVTHDVKEALWLAGQIILLSPKPSQPIQRIDLEIPYGERTGSQSLLSLERELLDFILKN
ncbi:MAG: ABC transporter ATP-binding protein [Firmicutes bacterium]|nr:ABC transporter ATP-binding protein [Bacillota bacterium]